MTLPNNFTLLGEYKPQRLTTDLISLHVAKQQDSPTEIFRLLHAAFQAPETIAPQGLLNAVDITGAKKSMIIGSFLYAAHSNLAIIYVDFDEFNARYGKPYGHTCRIGKIDDPYEAFQLRDWERVRLAYKKHNFRAAYQFLIGDKSAIPPIPGILSAMTTRLDKPQLSHPQSHLPQRRQRQLPRSLYNQEECAAVEQLGKVLQAYEAWENGQYVEAKQRLTALAIPVEHLPKAVAILGDHWPQLANVEQIQGAETRHKAASLLANHRNFKRGLDNNDSHKADDDKATDPTASLFNNQAWVLAYAHDECAKIRRLIDNNEDYRSAYLRSAGLDEFLLKARAAISWIYNEGSLISIQDNQGTNTQPLRGNQQVWRNMFAKLIKESQAQVLIRFLQRSTPFNFGDNRGKGWLTVSAPTFEAYWNDLALDFDKVKDKDGYPVFRHLRNEAIHTNLFIPQDIAEAALEIVKESLAEFRKNWLNLYPVQSELAATDFDEMVFDAPMWSQLLNLCQIQFLPPSLSNEGLQQTVAHS